MRRSILPAFSLVILLLGACSSPQPAPMAPAAKDSGAILGVIRAQEAAWNRGEVDGFMSAGYLESPELTFFSQGDVTKGYQPVLARYTKRYKSEGAEMGHLEFSGVETIALGPDAALARGRWQLGFQKKSALGGLFTLVFRRTADGWRIVHDHTSVDAQ